MEWWTNKNKLHAFLTKKERSFEPLILYFSRVLCKTLIKKTQILKKIAAAPSREK
jgi:hypothetical protein